MNGLAIFFLIFDCNFIMWVEIAYLGQLAGYRNPGAGLSADVNTPPPSQTGPPKDEKLESCHLARFAGLSESGLLTDSVSHPLKTPSVNPHT